LSGFPSYKLSKEPGLTIALFHLGLGSENKLKMLHLSENDSGMVVTLLDNPDIPTISSDNLHPGQLMAVVYDADQILESGTLTLYLFYCAWPKYVHATIQIYQWLIIENVIGHTSTLLC